MSTRLIDTSVWVSVLRGGASPTLAKKVEAALGDGTAAMTEPVWMELYCGVRGKRDLARLKNLRKLCQWLPINDACWKLSFEVARACREKGVNVPIPDVMIFACARHYEAELLHEDKHFTQISRAARAIKPVK
jgi:predicted nucleic acid-binding protein